MSKNRSLRPILKWVGGKRQLLSSIRPLVPQEYDTYYEPFIGGGAVLFDLQPEKAVINDSNTELINVYECIRDHPADVVKLLEEHAAKNSSEYFYKIRSQDRKPEYAQRSAPERAARIIYLNKTCYNGLYRVNSAGQFNTPYGRYAHPNIVNKELIEAMSEYLQGQITILNSDYQTALATADEHSFVYLDPPYMPISSSASFTGYTEGGFGYEEQRRLKKTCDDLKKQKVHFLESNSDCDDIRKLYSEYDITIVEAKRSVNSKANKRGAIKEVLIHD
ncbi:DNA adenine methylase [uncultured Bifidobacterium sp.]|uniref:DNA adenine methylase n=1 Tax=uncultured Bifidobacterium sp. TaxID=165187 RepID=UPI002638F130|nr:DNA adenine methylase [uncultured Bifidobacterium sp.]